MNCKTAQNLLSAYLDSELAGYEMQRMRRHLSQCPCCRQEEMELRALKSILTSTPMVEPPADFEEKLCSAIFAKKTPETQSWHESWPLLSGVALITAAVTLLVITRVDAVQPQRAQTPDVMALELQRDQTSMAGGDPLMGPTTFISTTNYARK